MDLLFSEAPGAVSMRNFYIEQSSNRYTVNGDVTDWVTVPFSEAIITDRTIAVALSVLAPGSSCGFSQCMVQRTGCGWKDTC